MLKKDKKKLKKKVDVKQSLCQNGCTDSKSQNIITMPIGRSTSTTITGQENTFPASIHLTYSFSTK